MSPGKLARGGAYMMNFETTTDLLGYQADAVTKLLPSRVGALFMEMGTGDRKSVV